MFELDHLPVILLFAFIGIVTLLDLIFYVVESRMTNFHTCVNGNHEWTSRYDHDTHPGAVVIVEAVCKRCGIKEQGSGQ